MMSSRFAAGLGSFFIALNAAGFALAQSPPPEADKPAPEKPAAEPPATVAPGAFVPPTRERFHQDVAWSLDGSYIAYSEYTPVAPGAKFDESRWAVKVMPVDGSSPPKTLVENAMWVSWASSGDAVIFAAQVPAAGAPPNHEIHRIDSDGRNRKRLTKDPARDTQPAWSPRGDRIVFASDRSADNNLDLYIMDNDGANVRRLTTDAGRDQCPAWSPDGATIAFYREVEGGRDQVYTIAADGTGETRITQDEALNTFPSFLPILSGRRGDTPYSVLFSCKRKGEAPRLVVVSRTGPPTPGDFVRMEPLRGVPAWFARMSPDGRSVAIIVGEWPKSAIYIVDPRDPPRFRKVVN